MPDSDRADILLWSSRTLGFKLSVLCSIGASIGDSAELCGRGEAVGWVEKPGRLSRIFGK